MQSASSDNGSLSETENDPAARQAEDRGPDEAEDEASVDPTASPDESQSIRAIPLWVLIVSSLGMVCILGLGVCLTLSACRLSLMPEPPPELWIPSALGVEWNEPRVQKAFHVHCAETFPGQEGCDLLAGLAPRFQELQLLEACRNPGPESGEQSPLRPRLSDLFFLARDLAPSPQGSRLLGIADRDLSCDEYLAYTQGVIDVRVRLADLSSALDDVVNDRALHQKRLADSLHWGILLDNTVALLEQARNSEQKENIPDFAAEMRSLKLPFFVAGDAAMIAYLNDVFGMQPGSSLRERLMAYSNLAQDEGSIENLPFMKAVKHVLDELNCFAQTPETVTSSCVPERSTLSGP